ncbi:MAG TPA: protein translocase subunit SecD [Alphaproteobacteria bacterium]|nr:protein translocase subunit SecD [Alphaproteobacteria bacterium]
MVHLARWKIILILAVCALAVIYSLPNVLSPSARQFIVDKLPAVVPSKTVNLGLDLQGGSHLLLQVDLKNVMKERSESLVTTLRPELRGEKIGYKRLKDLDNGFMVQLRDGADMDAVKKIIRGIDRDLILSTEGNDTIEAVFSDQAIKAIQDQTIGQSIEIVRRRIDETGTREPIIQRQGDDRILVQLPGLDDPQRVKDLLGKTAKLTFHLVDMEAARTGNTMVLPMANEPGQTIIVNRRAELTGDMLVNAQYAPDSSGQSAVSFRFNTAGAKRFCDLSRENVNRLFAIVLDNEVISAPVIREPICGGQGQISGNFSVKEASDLALLLRAGALPAPLSILEERTVGPSLGADSVQAGKIASIIGLAGVLVFMLITYGRFGVYASVALMVNVALIFALLSSLQATLTLPGIAGIVLTIGMAVDANVLIFERIKEELSNGRSVMSAVDTGFSKAMGTIIDSNLTTLIAALILYSFGTGPIKGFSVTLAIGIVTSMFSAIMVTRLLIVTWLHKSKPTKLNI